MTYHLINGFSVVFVLTSCHSSGFLLDTTPTYACVDQQQNCDVFNASYAVCKDLHHAYQLCRKFCGLCSVVNGGWSIWSAWGVCDVTCANGTMTRTRLCNNPTPVNGGEDCQGPSQINGECLLNKCPTHGGWSVWNEWGSCSVTCGLGLRRRDRYCDNPWPSSDGHHCSGDNINYEICSKPVCDLLKTTWTDWGPWSSCSDTCGYGLKERYRNCSGTSEMQNFCVGSDVQNMMCKTSCKENRYQLKIPMIYFYARNLASYSVSEGQTVVYTYVQFNDGQGYDPATGRFTVSVPGLYVFAVQYCVAYHSVVGLEIVNQKQQLQSAVFRDSTGDYPCVSMQVFIKADMSDQIWVKSTGSSHFDTDSVRFDSFSGALVHV